MRLSGMVYRSRQIEFAGLCAAQAAGARARAEENKARFHAGLSRNIYCDRIDAVIAASLPRMRCTPSAAASDYRFVTCASPEVRAC
ncbi:hypothetical protein CupriaWKF_18060 [Cupriavidus sp. WKF15]|uniref:hypothetical protein n=1 Tax=Cupriavidus sp. WKF15 TaxID=3032282 RepID=UPI0023E22A62|nr:hypothetical protein [Cupriavidus sp. WKF15]WER49079.1 hypothetical protein CupriaWKF_18060 [Cupriavidus sp. WKF15]